MSVDHIPELNKVSVASPTEDGKLAYAISTCVPRQLEDFTDIKQDLSKIVDKDNILLYANYKNGDFCNKSYKVTLPELGDYISKVETVDNNFKLEDKKLELIIDPVSGESHALADKLASTDAHITALEEEIAAKPGKFVVMGDGDTLDSEGNVIPSYDSEGVTKTQPASGVHVTYDGKDAWDRDKIVVSHEDIVGGKGWISKFEVGGIPKNRFFEWSTSIKEIVRLALLGDPMLDNAIYFGALEKAPTVMEGEVIGKLTFQSTTYDSMLGTEKLGELGFTWSLGIDCADKHPIVVVPERLWDNPSSDQPGIKDKSGNDRQKLDLLDCWLWSLKDTDSEGNSGAPESHNVVSGLVPFEDESGHIHQFKYWMINDDTSPSHDELRWVFKFKKA